ncbi:hypothetical protein QJS10_CPB22g01000 [Acorus calamus]|uniref:2Fe-2S ferredoxin-type domain-containing protein n=1 Tax=Acorus calamus TaxID=4465 RepID=A0AAV9C255_ACOCL|nr:hypothetical protein QJS10_CPB22g01000 [Acorus calamus]
MSALNFLTLPLQPTRRPTRHAANASNPDTAAPPEIELEFVSPKPGLDNTYQKQRLSVKSGEKVLRNLMTENKIELYGAYGKVMNCGGGGSCGTCIFEGVQFIYIRWHHEPLLSGFALQKPESWRLACQTIVGNKENSGTVTVQRLPQWKK